MELDLGMASKFTHMVVSLLSFCLWRKDNNNEAEVVQKVQLQSLIGKLLIRAPHFGQWIIQQPK